MLQDKLQMFHIAVAIATASEIVDTGSENAETELKIQAGGTTIAATGDVTLTLTSSATSGGTYAADMTIAASADEIMKGLIFAIPNHAKRYLKLTFTGTSISGNVTTGLVVAGQTSF